MKLIFAVGLAMIIVLPASYLRAEEQGIPNTKITPVPCQIIVTPETKMTVCIEGKETRGAACNAIEAGLCWSNGVTAPPMGLALPLVKAAKDAGKFRDLGECEEVARDAGRLAGILGPEASIAGVIAGKCGECVCRAAY